jgi:nicotinamidase-related amidase
VIVKHFPDSFVQTDLDDRLKAGSTQNLVLAGFMTHMCVNSTARGAFNLGYRPAVVAGATATRPLPGPSGVVSSEALQAGSLAAIADLFGIVVPNVAAIPE